MAVGLLSRPKRRINRNVIVDPVVEFNPNFVFLMASGPVGDPAQRTLIQNDIINIHSTTSGARRPDIGCNLSWDECETSLGVYNWTKLNNLRAMARAINVGIGLPEDSPNGCKIWLKIFIRSYSAGSQPSVPAYMQSTAGTSYAGNVTGQGSGGTGANSNGEYEGVLGAGSGSGNVTRQAKMWVPAVAERFKAWLQAIGLECNGDPLFAGVIINETSVLNCKEGSGMSPDVPTSNGSIMYTYFQNYFQAIIDARPSLSKKELMISANSPVAKVGNWPDTMYTMTPLNPSELYTKYKIGQLIQDWYAVSLYTPKFSIREIVKNTQPHAINACSYAALISPDVRRHRGTDANSVYSAASLNVATGTFTAALTTTAAGSTKPTLETVMNKVPSGGGPRPGKDVVFMTALGFPGFSTMSGKVTAYNETAGVATFNITSKTGSGTRSPWEISLAVIGEPSSLPPNTLDELVTDAVTARQPPAQPWYSGGWKGATHVFFQITYAHNTDTAEGPRNYREYREYVRNTLNQVKKTRPLLYG